MASPAQLGDPATAPPSAAPSGEARLDHIIKGTPAANSKVAQAASSYVQVPSIPHVTQADVSTPPAVPKNPLDSLPTSPPVIYHNLLIIEASMRTQYRQLHIRRRKYTVFLILLTLWTSYFFNAVYIIGPSPYSIVSTFEKLALLGGAVTFLLFWMSGLYAKTMIWPRRIIGNANKGLRMFNVKLVVVNRTFSQRLRDWLEIVARRHPLGWRYAIGLKKVPPPRHVLGHTRKATSIAQKSGLRVSPVGTPGTPPPRSAADVLLAQRALGNTRPVQVAPEPYFDPEDYLQSGSGVRLVILAKNFSADFREGWEIYRTEYWDKENERREYEVQAIKTSIRETGQLPPMTSHGGVVVSAGVTHHEHRGSISGTPFPGISSRPARKPSVSGGTSGNVIVTRHRARSSVAGAPPDPDGTLRSPTSAGVAAAKAKTRPVRKKSSASSLRPQSSIEDFDTTKASMDVKLKRRSLTRAPGTGSSTDTMADTEEGPGGGT